MDSYISSTEQNNHTTQCTKQIPIKYLKACRSLHNTLSFYLYMHVKYCALEQDRTCVQSSSTWNGCSEWDNSLFKGQHCPRQTAAGKCYT